LERPLETPRRTNLVVRKPITWIVGVWIVVVVLLLESTYALSITPSRFFSDWQFYFAYLSWSGFGWFWIGNDMIRGKRKRSRGFLHSWLMLAIAFGLGGVTGYIPILASIGYSAIGAVATGISAKLAWQYQIKGRVRYCTRCGTYRMAYINEWQRLLQQVWA